MEDVNEPDPFEDCLEDIWCGPVANDRATERCNQGREDESVSTIQQNKDGVQSNATRLLEPWHEEVTQPRAYKAVGGWNLIRVVVGRRLKPSATRFIVVKASISNFEMLQWLVSDTSHCGYGSCVHWCLDTAPHADCRRYDVATGRDDSRSWEGISTFLVGLSSAHGTYCGHGDRHCVQECVKKDADTLG